MDGDVDAELASRLIEALDVSQAALCLCDDGDRIRYANEAFRAAFFPGVEVRGEDFMDAIVAAIRAGRGIKLESTSPEAFRSRIRTRRRLGSDRFEFPVDLVDGSWWWVSDRRLPSGWLLAVANEITALKREELRLRDAADCALLAAQTDFLTALPNRRAGMERAALELQEFRTNRLPLTLALLDLDHFKHVNDTFGHEAGDAVLVRFAGAMGTLLGTTAHASRVGGEEFMLVLPGSTASRAADRIDRMRRDIAPVEVAPGRTLRVSFSAGLAPCHHSDDLRSLLSRADAALYAAKLNGRGRTEIGRHVAKAA